MSSQLELIDLTLRNFLTVGNITQAVRLNSTALTLIMGINAETGQRNGVGKSTIIFAISYVLYGEPISDMKLDNLVNNINAKNMLVTINFKKDGKTYRIERGRKPNVLKFFIDGKDQNEAKGENKSTQKDIETVIGMSHLLFTHLVGMNTYTDPFLKMKAAQQRELIEELLGISLLSQRDEVAKKLVSDSKRAIDIAQASIKATIDANSRIDTAIERTKNDAITWENSHKLRLINLQSALDRIESIDFDSELLKFDAIAVYENTVKELKNELSKLNLTLDNDRKSIVRIKQDMKSTSMMSNIDGQVGRLQADLTKQETILKSNVDHKIRMLSQSIETSEEEINAYLDTIASHSVEQSHLESHLESDDHFCNACGQKYNDETHLLEAKEKIVSLIEERIRIIDINKKNISRIEHAIVIKERDIDSIEQDHKNAMQLAEDRIIEIEKEIEQLFINQEKDNQLIDEKTKRYEEELSFIQLSVEKTEADIAMINTDITAMIKPVSPYRSKEEVWALRDQKDQLLRDIEAEYEKQNPHDQNIKNLESTKEVISYDHLNNLRDDLMHEEFLHKLLSGKDSFIRKKIIDQNLYYLNSRINGYLEQIGLPHEVKFNSDLSVQISYMGNDYDYPQLSRGQQARLILSTNWAFRDIWENLNFPINLLFVDELLDSGMDDAGAEAGMGILNKMAREQKRNAFLVSHKEVFIGRVDHTLLVHLEDQFTRFETDGVV